MVFRPKNQVSDFSNDLVVGAPNLGSHDLVGAQAWGQRVDRHKGLRAWFCSSAYCFAALPHHGLPGTKLLFGFVLVVVAQGGHQRSRDELSDIPEEAFTVGVTAVRSQCESCIAKAAQVANCLQVRGTAEPWAL
jgi:hypothetical protein